MFQGIERVWQGDRESLGLVVLAERPRTGVATSTCSRRLCSTPAFRRSSRPTGTSTSATAACTCRMRSRRSGSSAGPAVASGSTPACWRRRHDRSVSDVDIYNEDGRLAARVRGLRSHRVAGGRDESLDDLLYAYQWRPQPRAGAGHSAGTGKLADLRGQRRHGRTARARAPGSWRSCTVGPRRLDVSRTAARDITGSIPAGRKMCCGSSRPSSRPDRLPCRGVVHLWNLDAPPPDGLSTAALRSALRSPDC